VVKYYSENPRTCFKFMRWDHYVMSQNRNTSDTEAQSQRDASKKQVGKSKLKGHEPNKSRGPEVP
jgi:hypothetical protein